MTSTPLAPRRLGTNGPEITTVGFGAWAIGGGWSFAWGAQDDAASVAAIRHAVARGVSRIDTAAVYGLERSEEVVGRALADIPHGERPLVFTKCGLRWNPNDAMEVSARDSSPPRIREECGGLSASGVLRPRWSRILPIAIWSVTKAMRLMRWPQRVHTSGSTW